MEQNGKPLVSVLMTVYNREKYLAEAIESVINSTYKNWELLIVDDCSKDSSVEIAKKYENRRQWCKDVVDYCIDKSMPKPKNFCTEHLRRTQCRCNANFTNSKKKFV